MRLNMKFRFNSSLYRTSRITIALILVFFNASCVLSNAEIENANECEGLIFQDKINHNSGVRILSASCGGCTLYWKVYTEGVNEGTVIQNSTCSSSTDTVHKLFSEIISRSVNNGLINNIDTLVLKDIKNEIWLKFILSNKGSILSAEDSVIHKKNGANRFVYDLLKQDRSIYSEIDITFKAHQINAELKFVENIRMVPAGETPFFDKLITGGFNKSDLVPYKGTIGFEFKHK